MNRPIVPDLVSTIIPVFNRPTMVVESIQSVLDQTYRPIEIIVVDDGSTDETFEVLQNLAAQHPELTVLQQANAGPGVARELGRQYAKGEYLQYLDSDDLLLPIKFSSQVKLLTENFESVAAYGMTERIELGKQRTGQAWKQTAEVVSCMFPAFLRSRWWGTSTPLYRRSETDKVGSWLTLINEEDWEYDCRIASLGGKLAYVNEFVSIQRSHKDHLSDQGTTNKRKLAARCSAREKIYQHGLFYMSLENRLSDIRNDDWQFFSKSVFLLCRECAIAGMVIESDNMLKLSIKAVGAKTMQHHFFIVLKSLLGWRGAAKIVKALGR